MKFDDPQQFDGEVKAITPKAILVEVEDAGEIWFPKSQSMFTSVEKNTPTTVTIDRWLAESKGLVEELASDDLT